MMTTHNKVWPFVSEEKGNNENILCKRWSTKNTILFLFQFNMHTLELLSKKEEKREKSEEK